jgi:hypothetical protein
MTSKTRLILATAMVVASITSPTFAKGGGDFYLNTFNKNPQIINGSGAEFRSAVPSDFYLVCQPSRASQQVRKPNVCRRAD